MKQIVFGNEHLSLAKGVRGVYKVTMNDSWFYIGSSIDIKRRLSCWKHYLSKDSREFKKNRSIKHLMPTFERVNFEVIELVDEGVSPKIREDFYIKQSFDNEWCLNLIPNAVTGKGRKLPIGVVRREKKKKGLPTQKKPVAVFDLTGKLIMKCESILDAHKKTGVKEDAIRKVFSGAAVRPNKYIFKPILKDGSIEEIKYSTKLTPEIVEYIFSSFSKLGMAELSRITGIRETRISDLIRGRIKKYATHEGIIPKGVVQKPKRVIKMDLIGNELETYPSINSASKATGIRLSTIQDILYERGRYQTKGYKFKFA